MIPRLARYAPAGIVLVLMVIGVTLVSLSCSSRYRLDLFMQMDDQRQRAEVETTQYVIDAKLGNVLAETKIEPGRGSVVIVTTGNRWPNRGGAGLSIIGYDEYLRTQLYLELPIQPQPDSFSLPGRSFVTILGRYDWPVEDKAFLPQEGFYLIDSIASGRLFMTIRGTFHNRNGAELAYDGQFKIKADIEQ